MPMTLVCFFHSQSGVDLANKANKTLKLIYSWATKNNLKINVHKTMATIFRPHNKFLDLPAIMIGNKQLEIVGCFKTLGVYFSENLSWDRHVNYLAGKLSQVIGCMRRHCQNFPISVNRALYMCLFSSSINYGALVWATTTADNINKLLVLQKRAIRIVTKVPYLAHTAQLFQQLKIISVKSLYSFRLCRCYKTELNKREHSLAQLSNLTINVPAYCTRHPEHYKVDTCRTDYGTQMLKYRLPTILNQLTRESNTDIASLSLKNLRDNFL